MKIGDRVSLKDVRRAQFAYNGYPAYFDEGIDVEGVVKSTAEFIGKRVTIAFTHEHREYMVSMYESEILQGLGAG